MLPLEITRSVLFATALGTTDGSVDVATAGAPMIRQAGFDYVQLEPLRMSDSLGTSGFGSDFGDIHTAGWSTDETLAKSSCARFIWWSKSFPAYRIRICVQPTRSAPDPRPVRGALSF